MACAVFLSSGCSPKLELRDDLPDSAFACMQQYAQGDDPLTRRDGSYAPESSFLTINDGRTALEWRLAMIDSARHTLDIQYFLWKTDDTGSLLVRRVLSAANRGVKVRVLMDDFDSANWNRRATVLDLHPNIEIRVFNPFKKKRGKWAGRGFELISDLDRLNHRMHNKLLMADSKAAIVGGRNLGNEYFGAGSKLDYRDYDVIAIGPVVEELEHSFTLFWDGIWSYGIRDLPEGEADEEKIGALRAELDHTVMESTWLSQEFDVSVQEWSDRIASARAEMTTGPARAVFDCPPPQGEQFPVQAAATLKAVTDSVKEEILAISPYMVPLEGFHSTAKEINGRGVKITLLTNSLAATDHTYAFSGYKKHRERLLQDGMHIRELRPDGPMWEIHRLSASKAKHVALHAKIAVYDRRFVYIGSLNLDPRSVHWNTELGVLVDSPELAAQVYRDFAPDLRPENSWQVELRDPEGTKSGGKPELVWIAGKEETTKEPATGVMQRIGLWFYSLLPLDEQL